MRPNQFEMYRASFFQKKGAFTDMTRGMPDFKLPDMLWTALFIGNGEIAITEQLKLTLASQGKSIMKLPLNEVVDRLKNIYRSNKKLRGNNHQPKQMADKGRHKGNGGAFAAGRSGGGWECHNCGKDEHQVSNCTEKCAVCGSTKHKAWGVKRRGRKKVPGTGWCDFGASDYAEGPDLEQNGFDKETLMEKWRKANKRYEKGNAYAARKAEESSDNSSEEDSDWGGGDEGSCYFTSQAGSCYFISHVDSPITLGSQRQMSETRNCAQSAMSAPRITAESTIC